MNKNGTGNLPKHIISEKQGGGHRRQFSTNNAQANYDPNMQGSNLAAYDKRGRNTKGSNMFNHLN